MKLRYNVSKCLNEGEGNLLGHGQHTRNLGTDSGKLNFFVEPGLLEVTDHLLVDGLVVEVSVASAREDGFVVVQRDSVQDRSETSVIAIVQLREAKPDLFLWAKDEVVGGFADCLIVDAARPMPEQGLDCFISRDLLELKADDDPMPLPPS